MGDRIAVMGYAVLLRDNAVPSWVLCAWRWGGGCFTADAHSREQGWIDDFDLGARLSRRR